MSYAILRATLHTPMYDVPAKYPIYYSNSRTIISFPHAERAVYEDSYLSVIEYSPTLPMTFKPSFEILKYNRTSIHTILVTPKKMYLAVFDGNHPLVMFVNRAAYRYVGRNSYAYYHLPAYPLLNTKMKPFNLLFHGNLFILRFQATRLVDELVRNKIREAWYDCELQISNHRITANKELTIFRVPSDCGGEAAYIVHHPRDTLLRFDHPEHGTMFLSTRKPAFILLHHPRFQSD